MNNQSLNSYVPDYAVTPGEVLAYELELRNMTQTELAKRMGVTKKHINSIVHGKGTTIITPETAIGLERAIGMPVQYWLNLESNYQEDQARLADALTLEKDLAWLKRIPVNVMSKTHIEAVSAWLRKGELDAAAIECEPYDKRTFRHALNSARNLTTEANLTKLASALTKLCAKAGVAVVFVPGLPKTPISGATRWIAPDKAIIHLSMRYKSNDHLWFTFFHEAGHILLHGKKELFLENRKTSSNPKEKEADAFAQDILIPPNAYKTFLQQAALTLPEIEAFAQQIQIAAGIVVGRLQHDGRLRHNMGNKLKIFYDSSNDKLVT